MTPTTELETLRDTLRRIGGGHDNGLFTKWANILDEQVERFVTLGDAVRSHTVERCAQVAERELSPEVGAEVAAAIRALDVPRKKIDMGDDDRDVTQKLQGSYDLAMESCTSALMPYEYLIEAKNEIEKLRAERAGDQQRLFHYEAEIERLKKENAALYKYSDLEP